jgi:hypothetical protein
MKLVEWKVNQKERGENKAKKKKGTYSFYVGFDKTKIFLVFKRAVRSKPSKQHPSLPRPNNFNV